MTLPTAPPNLDILRRIENPIDRAVAATAYITQRKHALTEARKIRDDAIHLLAADGLSSASIAAAVGVSLSTVKFVRRLQSG